MIQKGEMMNEFIITLYGDISFDSGSKVENFESFSFRIVNKNLQNREKVVNDSGKAISMNKFR